jgi:hypothetical protein
MKKFTQSTLSIEVAGSSTVTVTRAVKVPIIRAITLETGQRSFDSIAKEAET